MPDSTQTILSRAAEVIRGLEGHHFDILNVGKPADTNYAQNLAKIISKMSPLLGNLIELEVVRTLNTQKWDSGGKWERQDPGFPDAVYRGGITPLPGIEIKTWFPFATEITARFRDSVTFFSQDQTHVAVLAWLPEFIIYGRPKIIGVWIGSGLQLATSRDNHYHRPPDYLVTEPEDTKERTSNLQQTNVNGLKFQGTAKQKADALAEVQSWGKEKAKYSPDRNYQALLKGLQAKYPYRLDTNFAKIDRVVNPSLEEFKKRVLGMTLDGAPIAAWPKILAIDTHRMAKLLGLPETEGSVGRADVSLGELLPPDKPED
ncbi:MAG TPA: hypothetical protein VG734_08545 [Lacunisphaera sp.]|nr:hypothetical protein [Lacunisphaera sp.]